MLGSLPVAALAIGRGTAMRIRAPVALAQAIEALRGGLSYFKLSHHLARLTEAEVDLNPTRLHGLEQGTRQRSEVIDSGDEAVLFTLAMMTVALQNEQVPEVVLKNGRAILCGFLGDRVGGRAFEDLALRATQITDSRTLAVYLRTLIMQWREGGVD